MVWRTELEVRLVEEPGGRKVVVPRSVLLLVDRAIDALGRVEWALYCRCIDDGSRIVIAECWAPRQRVSHGYFEFLDPVPPGGVTIHSHHVLGAFFSSIDLSSTCANSDACVVVAVDGAAALVSHREGKAKVLRPAEIEVSPDPDDVAVEEAELLLEEIGSAIEIAAPTEGGPVPEQSIDELYRSIEALDEDAVSGGPEAEEIEPWFAELLDEDLAECPPNDSDAGEDEEVIEEIELGEPSPRAVEEYEERQRFSAQRESPPGP